MSIIVQKFGGSSVASPMTLQSTANHVAQARAAGHQVVVVVSAMAGVTDQLIHYVQEISVAPNGREYDMVVAAGEQVTCGLMALALKNLGVPAQSCLGWQVPILTSSHFTKAHIHDIDCSGLIQTLQSGVVPVVAGFQGIDDTRSITTLGRGGSDLTAVALAARLRAERCDLYKDVEALYTADPKIVSQARPLSQISLKEMLELSALGSKILQTRAVKMAISHGVKLRIVPTFGHQQGTLLTDDLSMMETGSICGVVCGRSQTQVIIQGCGHVTSAMALLFKNLASAHISIDMIHHSFCQTDQSFHLSFTVANSELDQAVALTHSCKDTLQFKNLETHANLTKISIVGVGLCYHADFMHVMLDTLAARGIEIYATSTSEVKISVLIHEEYAELAVRALHTAYHLDKDITS